MAAASVRSKEGLKRAPSRQGRPCEASTLATSWAATAGAEREQWRGGPGMGKAKCELEFNPVREGEQKQGKGMLFTSMQTWRHRRLSVFAPVEAHQANVGEEKGLED